MGIDFGFGYDPNYSALTIYWPQLHEECSECEAPPFRGIGLRLGRFYAYVALEAV